MENLFNCHERVENCKQKKDSAEDNEKTEQYHCFRKSCKTLLKHINEAIYIKHFQNI